MATALEMTTARVDPMTLAPGDFVFLSGWCYVTGEVTRTNTFAWSIPLVREDGEEGLVTIHQEAEKLTSGQPVNWRPEQIRRQVERLRKRADVLTQLAVKLDVLARGEIATKAEELHASYSRITAGQAKPWGEMNEIERAGWYHRAQEKLDKPS